MAIRDRCPWPRRAERDACRELLARDIDPAVQPRAEAAKAVAAQKNSLRDIAETWFAKQSWSARHRREWEGAMKRHVFDQVVQRRALGEWPVTETKTRHVMEVLQRLEDQDLIETLHRCRQKLVHIFNRAIALELRDGNPVIPLTKELPVPGHEPW